MTVKINDQQLKKQSLSALFLQKFCFVYILNVVLIKLCYI